MLFVLDFMQVTFVTKPTVDLPIASFNSQGIIPMMGTQAKTIDITKHMPTEFQL